MIFSKLKFYEHEFVIGELFSEAFFDSQYFTDYVGYILSGYLIEGIIFFI